MSIDDLVKEAQFLPEKLIDTLVCYARYLREDYSLTHTVEQHRAATENYRDRAEIAHKMLEAKKARIESANSADNQNEEDDKYKGWYRKPGLLKGKIFMADDFDEPLEEFKEYML